MASCNLQVANMAATGTCIWQGILPGQAARARHICEALQTLMMRPLIPIEGRRQGYKAKRIAFPGRTGDPTNLSCMHALKPVYLSAVPWSGLRLANLSSGACGHEQQVRGGGPAAVSIH